MIPFLLVCLGGALGSGARFLVATGSARAWGTAFPVGTAIVNLVGSFLLGAIAAAAGRGALGEPARLFLGPGLMGGLTTYSSFNWETLVLLDGRRLPAAAANLALTVGGCLAAAALGAALAGGFHAP